MDGLLVEFPCCVPGKWLCRQCARVADEDVLHTETNDAAKNSREQESAPAASAQTEEVEDDVVFVSSSEQARVTMYDAPVSCVFCNFQHINELYLLTHEVMRHGYTIESLLTCVYEKAYVEKFFHRESGSKRKKVECKLCSSVTDNIKSHLVRHCVQEKHNCAKCTFSSPSSSAISRHRVTHTKSQFAYFMAQEYVSAIEFVSRSQPLDEVGENSLTNKILPQSSQMSTAASGTSDVHMKQEEKVEANPQVPLTVKTDDVERPVAEACVAMSPVNSFTPSLMTCPMCTFLCNDTETMIKHVIQHT